MGYSRKYKLRAVTTAKRVMPVVAAAKVAALRRPRCVLCRCGLEEPQKTATPGHTDKRTSFEQHKKRRIPGGHAGLSAKIGSEELATLAST